MKVKIPQEHFDFYRLLYRYLSENEAVPMYTPRLENFELTRTLIKNYLTKNQTNKSNGILIDESLEKTSSSFSTNKHSNKLALAVSELHERIANCKNCFLGGLRKQYVSLPKLAETTSSDPKLAKPFYPIMLLIDIPSFYDQTQGKYFSDEAGILLKKIIASIDLVLENIYYSGVIKCSYSQEISNQLAKAFPCQEHLLKEVKLLNPELIIGFGKNTYDFIFKSKIELEKNLHLSSSSFNEQLGKTLDYHGVDIVFTHHPKDLLFDPRLKKSTWEHLKIIKPMVDDIKERGARIFN